MKKIYTLILTLAALVITSCYAPNPLYGKWTDNIGDSITFIAGDGGSGGFVAKIKSDDEFITYQGDWTVIDNALTFTYSYDNKANVLNTEWDIRGSILYLYWTIDGAPRHITLYKVSN